MISCATVISRRLLTSAALELMAQGSQPCLWDRLCSACPAAQQNRFSSELLDAICDQL